MTRRAFISLAGGRYILHAGGGEAQYSHSDWLGTVRSHTYNGSACESTTSLPFGDGQVITNQCYHPSTLHFTGKERDAESGLDDFGARYFGSSLGRFQTPDPLLNSG